ncbi:MAG: hypothetical protein CVU89_16410 [Firmicutes bacterium HGW-Firmicutes-14]|nr:MAG: hypothetical protein CVU89_16410 [Firmicutes bacterium HGW-Firmicutes-14]
MAGDPEGNGNPYGTGIEKIEGDIALSEIEERCYITFPAISKVLQAEKCLAGLKTEFMVVPIPREISADCGMCIMCYPGNVETVVKLLAENKIEYENTHILRKKKLRFFG